MSRRLKQLHREESGAVAMLAMAGLMITFMTALILYDAGFGIRHKFKAQISADAAAYTQASVRARTMNTVAYFNVIKRTMSGVWGMYIGMMYQFYLENVGNIVCALGTTGDIEFLRFFTEGIEAYQPPDIVYNKMLEFRDEVNANCDGGADQFDIFYHEVRGDWDVFSDQFITEDGYAAFVARNDSFEAQKFRANFQRLDWLQGALLAAGPKWSSTEAQARGRASGADKIDAAAPGMPSTKGSPTQICLRGFAHVDGSIATGPELVEELRANHDIHARRSEAASKFKQGYETANLQAGLNYMGSVGCAGMMASFDDSMAPYIPTASVEHSAIATGRETPLASYRAQHFEFMEAQGDLGNPGVPMYQGVSCAETVDLAPQYRGFRASWTPRVAPVELCDAGRAGWWK